ncbi:MAG TPA: hypothetical protein VH107_15410, partial [Lacipirellulaceae bacterium]|nr:hypothetical protein [Lacipirellulaceae bacterium]
KPLAGPPQPMTPGLPPLATAPTAPSTASSSEPDRYAVTNNTTNNHLAIGLPAPSQPGATGSASATPPQTDAANVKPDATAATPPANTTASLPAAPPLASPPPAIIPPLASDAADSKAASSQGVADTGASPMPAATSVAASNPADRVAPLSGTPATPIAPTTEAAAPTKPAASIAPPDSGTYLGGKTVLLRYDNKSNAWFRVEPRAAIIPGERVIALPEFRPKIALISGVHLDLSGGTQVVMGGGKDAGPTMPADLEYIPTIEVIYGRIVLINPSNGEKQVRLKLGNTLGTAKIARNATLAAEVDPKHVAGQDPRQTPAPVEIRLFAPDGGIVWQDAAGQKSVEKSSRWTLTDAGASDPTPDPAPPEWIDHEPLNSPSEQRFGAPAIETTLVTGDPVENQLLQLFQGSSRKEVKSLVTRCSIHVGVFQPFIDALRDSDQKANWKSQIEALRSAMALSPESANKVYQALVDQRGKPAAADLYEMLCGYSADQIGRTPEEMKNGAVSKLINWLEDDSLDYRVLAVQDLWEITGKRLMLNPADKLPERTKNVKHWRTQLAEGDLKVVQPAN